MSGEVQTITYANMTIMVHRPALTEEERKKRMKSIQSEAEKLLLEVVKQKG